MEWLRNLTFSDITTAFFGLFGLIFCFMQAGEKFFGNLSFFQNLKKKKQQKEKATLKQIYDEFTNDFINRYEAKVIGEIRKTDENQNEKIDKLITSSNDVLRKELVAIYYRFLPYKKIPVYTKKVFMKLYHDYHDQGGNSFIDEIYDDLKDWIVVKTEEEALVKEVKN